MTTAQQIKPTKMGTKQTKPTKMATKLPRNVERFCSTIDAALEVIDKNLGAFGAYVVKHEDRGNGVIFSQLETTAGGGLKFSDVCHHQLAFVFKDGVGAAITDGPYLAFGKDQPPEKVAAMFVAALVSGEPIPFPECDCCSGDS